MIKHIHTPGIRVIIDDDQHWSTCTDQPCSRPIHTMLHDYDGDGVWTWTAWKPAPIPVGDVRPMGPQTGEPDRPTSALSTGSVPLSVTCPAITRTNDTSKSRPRAFSSTDKGGVSSSFTRVLTHARP